MASPKINQAALLAVAVQAIIIVVGASLWYFTSISLSEVKDKIEQEKTNLAKINNRPNFPSEHNIKAFEDVISKIESDIAQVRKALHNSTLSGESIPGDVFQTRFARLKQQLTETCKDLGISLPENFQFSFSFYATNTPSREDTEALTLQLGLVDKLTRVLIDARVNKINSIRRMIVEKNLPPGAILETTGGLTGLRADQASTIDYFPPLAASENLAYTNLPFVLEFESNENSLRKVINSLSIPPSLNEKDGNPYFVIRAIEITNSKTALPTLDVLRAATTQQTAAGTRQSNIRMPNFAQGSIEPRIVVGNELLQTRMRVDYIQLKRTADNSP
jgi:hypothetical protein